ncbi:hypothetical protein XMD420_001819 [Marinobacterium sp. xm-d-420]|uniref:hypothetical protein n=1 Tax=Marinobacterium sp. xm-d-420 TaxID=2497737 RepID=UPI001567FB7F|nr:hypothetical protein [Marinobacterium sp. xm-d-420]NRP28213.1 hypothetical protein [Marinobacterium sp. xm-d-420]
MLINAIDLKKLEQHFQREHVSRFGNGDETHTRALVAHHEAGHALLYALIGEYKQVKIFKDRELYWVGRTGDEGFTNLRPTPEVILAEIALLMSGYLAEKVCSRNYALSSSGMDRSFAKARSLLVSRYLDLDAEFLYVQLESIVTSFLLGHKASLATLSKRLRKAQYLPAKTTKLILKIEPRFDSYNGLGQFILSTLNYKYI